MSEAAPSPGVRRMAVIGARRFAGRGWRIIWLGYERGPPLGVGSRGAAGYGAHRRRLDGWRAGADGPITRRATDRSDTAKCIPPVQ